MEATYALFSGLTGFFAIFVLASLAGMISERSGVVNVGIEGFMIIGALTFSISGYYLDPGGKNQNTQFLAMIIAMIVCAGFAMLHALSAIKYNANQIVSGTAINILAQGIALFLATSKLMGFSTGVYIESGYTIMSFDSKNIFSIYLIIALIIALVIGMYFTFTKIGTRHAATGENPNAIDAAGISVLKYRYSAVAMSGALAGLAGAFFVIIKLQGKFMGSTQGWGFLALAIMIVGQWRSKYITGASFVFAFFFAFSRQAAYLNFVNDWVKSNATLFQVLPFVLSIATMVAVSKWSRPPKADGIPFDKSKR